MRLLIYSHDTAGLGHLRRCLKISDAFTSNFPGLSILLVTGSPVVHRYELPPGVDYVKLPAVRKTGSESYEARALGTTFERILKLRTEMLKETVRGFEPHLVLVDHSPTGMKGELLPSLEWLRAHRADTTVLLGLRDIIDDPKTVRELWNRDGVYDAIGRLYDHILVYGNPLISDPVTDYAFPAGLRGKTVFCNYVSQTRPQTSRRRRKNGRINRPLVLVTIGGGDGAVDTVIEPYLQMLRAHRHEIEFESVMLVGAFLSRQRMLALRRAARGLPVAIRPHITDTRHLLERAHVVLATAGYNTTVELLTYARRAVLIPRIVHRQEQYLRARRLAELGFVKMLHPEEVEQEVLFKTVREFLQQADEPLTLARQSNQIPLDGCARVVGHCRPIVAAKSRNLGDSP